MANMFGQPRPGLRGALVVLQIIGLLGGAGCGVAEAQTTVNMTVETTSEVFSPQWVEEFSGDNLGCELGRGLYTWRNVGFGSNINSEQSWEALTVTLDT